MRLPPALVMYSLISFMRGTSLASSLRMTASTAAMSSAMGVENLLDEGLGILLVLHIGHLS